MEDFLREAACMKEFDHANVMRLLGNSDQPHFNHKLIFFPLICGWDLLRGSKPILDFNTIQIYQGHPPKLNWAHFNLWKGQDSVVLIEFGKLSEEFCEAGADESVAAHFYQVKVCKWKLTLSLIE